MAKIHDAITALRAGGVRADWGHPQGIQMVPDSPIAAVSVAHSNQQETALQVWILGSAGQGGRVCEEVAQNAAGILRGLNACCEVGACQFDGETGLLTVEILAAWQVFLESQVAVDQVSLPYATDFSAVQTRQVTRAVDEETGEVTYTSDAVGWTLTIRELLPMGETAAVDGANAFTLTVSRENGVETYPQCYWSSVTLQETNSGLLRERTAKSWEERVIEE